MKSGIENISNFLEGVASEIDYALVGPRDNRIHEIRTKQFPFNTICHVERDFGNGLWSGCTGTLIAPRVVLTAGHCLYSHRRGRAPERIRVVPGRSDRDTMPYGSIISRHYYIPKRYFNARHSPNPDRKNFDYGIIILPRSFPQITDFMKIRALSNDNVREFKQKGHITIAGYPGDRPSGTLWRHTERLKGVTPRRILYTIDTCPGHSGSPIWYLSGKGRMRFIIGIHTSGILDKFGRSHGCKKGTILAPPGLMNSGVRIIPEVLKNIRNPNREVYGDGGRTMIKLP